MRAVVLVHGFLVGGWSMRWLGRRLKALGFEPVYYSYTSRQTSVSVAANDLWQFCRQIHATELHLIGHSLGGLVILDMLSRFNTKDLPRGHLVLLGSPVQGSSAAKGLAAYRWGSWLLGKAADVLGVGSSFLPTDRHTTVIAGVHGMGMGRFFAPLPMPHDGTVAVNETKLSGADWLSVSASHSGLLVSSDVFSYIKRILTEAHVD